MCKAGDAIKGVAVDGRPARGALIGAGGAATRPDRTGPEVIDLERREIRWRDGRRTTVSETEAALLKYLVANRGRPVSRDELLVRVWGIGSAGLETRTVDMHVARLRAKWRCGGHHADPPPVIVTVRSCGYMAGPGLLEVPVLPSE